MWRPIAQSTLNYIILLVGNGFKNPGFRVDNESFRESFQVTSGKRWSFLVVYD